MSTNVNSVVSYFPTAQNGFTTTTAGSVSSGAVTVTLNSVAGYTNGEPAVFVIDPTDVTKKQTFTGIIDTSGVQVTSVDWTAGTNTTHALGATVVDYATATHIAMMSKGIKVAHNQDGTLKTNVALTTNAATLTTPKVITSINDTNANELFKVTATGSAVNEFTVANAATGAGPTLSTTGGDTNIDFNIATKGTGVVAINGVKLGSISSSSNLGSRTQSLTPSGSGTIAYSTNNPTLTLTPGKYLLLATASARAAISGQDSSFNAVIYNDTSTAELVSNGTTSTGSSVTVYPTISVHAIVTPSVNTTYSGRVSQTFGSGAVYTYVNSTIIAIPFAA